MNIIDVVYQVETILKVIFIICAFIYPGEAGKLGLIICIIALLRRHKLPRMNREYLTLIVQN